MRIGVSTPLGAPFADAAFLRVLAEELDTHEIESFWLGEHVVTFPADASTYPYSASGKRSDYPGYGFVEPLTTLTALACLTSRVRLGTGILVLAQRNPVLTAFQVATLHFLSGGRFELGIGLNWNVEEYRALGVPWPERGARTDEYVALLRTLWREDPAEFHGRFYDLEPCILTPRLAVPPRIHVSGNSDPALARVARLGDGWYGLGLPPEEVARRLKVLDAELARSGRDRADVEITVIVQRPGDADPDRPTLDAYASCGVDRVVVQLATTDSSAIGPRLAEIARWASG